MKYSNSFKHQIFFAKNKFLRRQATNEYYIAANNERSSTKEILSLNQNKRIQLFEYARTNIPFYREHYKNLSKKKAAMESPKFWQEIPPLEKHHVRASFDQILNSDVSKKFRRYVTTGGSTGSPMRFVRDKRFPEEILQWRLLNRWGVSPADNRLMMWRTPSSEKSTFNKLMNSILWYPTKRLKVDVSVMDEQSMLNTYGKMNNKQIGLVWGYVGAICQFANFLIDNNLKLKFNPKCVWVTAAPLTHSQRRVIKKAFRAPVLDQYACSEVHWIAAGVPDSDKLVVDYDYRHVDIVDRQNITLPNNEYGDLLITDLHNYVFPLIKYRVGDRSCFVGQNWGEKFAFPMISPVKGRKSDFIRSKSDIIISGEYLTTIFDNYHSTINHFQIIQDKIDHVKILVVSNSDSLPNIMEKVINELIFKSRAEIEFNWEKVEEIPHDLGKPRFIKRLIS